MSNKHLQNFNFFSPLNSNIENKDLFKGRKGSAFKEPISTKNQPSLLRLMQDEAANKYDSALRRKERSLEQK